MIWEDSWERLSDSVEHFALHLLLQVTAADQVRDDLLDERFLVMLARDKVLYNKVLGDMGSDSEALLQLRFDTVQSLLIGGRREAFNTGEVSSGCSFDGGDTEKTESFLDVLVRGELLQFHLGETLSDTNDGFELTDSDWNGRVMGLLSRL